MSLQSCCNTSRNCRRNWAILDQNWLVSDQNWQRAEIDKPVFIIQINEFYIFSVWRNGSAETATETAFSSVKSISYGSLVVSVLAAPLRGVCVRANLARAHHTLGAVGRARDPPLITPTTAQADDDGELRQEPHHRRP